MSETARTNFIHQIIEEEHQAGKHNGTVYTRFPPEPNGFLHIGHAKAICLSFSTAEKYHGKCNLRFDDTNPSKEEQEYVDAIKEDVAWLGFKWDRETYSSDFFQQLYDFAVQLIEKGLAYVDQQSAEEIADQKGTPTKAGTESPYRNRPVAENLALFTQMKNGDFQEGECVLRAKIDMANPNMHLRDPLMYRIMNKAHHRTGTTWKIYPMYDFTHGQCDFFEGITHSLCTLEFEVHRPLYEWYVQHLKTTEYAPRQIEFARLNLSNTIMSKRKLLELVQLNIVDGWDDPRMPTISGMRRRGYTPSSIRKLADVVGIAKRNGVTDIALLESILREELNANAARRMAVLNPLKVVITNYEQGKHEELEAVNNPEDETAGTRKIAFSREIYIEKEDFMENAPRKFFRLSEGREVRLRYAYFITCNEVIKDDNDEIIELRCTYDPLSKGGKSPDGRKVKGTLHWVDAKQNINAEVRKYERLFLSENPAAEEGDYKDYINPESLKVLKNCKLETALGETELHERFQFERLGYFCKDKNSTDEALIFNQAVSLKDGWKGKK